MKKILSLLVICLIICTMVCLPSFANETDATGAVTFNFADATGTYVYSETDTPKEYKISPKTATDGVTTYVTRSTRLKEGSDSATASITFGGSVSLPKAGLYKVTYLIGRKVSNNTSNVTLSLGDYSFSYNDKSYAEDASTLVTALASYCPVTKYEKVLWFDEGNVDISFNAKPYGTNNVFRFNAAYVKFEPIINDNFKLKFAHYYTSSLQGEGTNPYVKFETSTGTKPDPFVLEIPVSFDKSGVFDITYLVGYKSGHSDVTLTLNKDGEEPITIGTNHKNGTLIEEGYVTSVAPMHRYEKSMEIQAGKYTLKLEMKPNVNDRWLGQFDYIEFIPQAGVENENTLTIEGNKVTANVYYEKEVSGTPIIALYNGEELVLAEPGETVCSADNVTIFANTTLDFDTVKVFVWDEMDSIIPQIGAVTLTK